jgi:subtilisin family serine protease
MQKKTPSESAFFNLRTITVCALFCAASSLAYLSFAGPAQPNSTTSTALKSAPASTGDWRAKVDPRVLASAALGQTDFIIYMAQQADLTGAAALATKDEKGIYVYQQLTSVAEATQPAVRLLLTRLGADFKAFWISNTISAKADLAVVEAMASLPEVAAIYPVGKGALKLPSQENAPSSPDAIAAAEPGLVRVNADDVWALGYRGQGVVVAGADTGVRFTHNALRNQYRGWGGSAATSTHDYNWHDAIHIPNWPPEPLNACNPGGPTGAGQPSPLPCDDDEVLGGGHGSHTMGSIAGDDGGANQIGMAPQAKWMACRNMSNGVGIIPTYLECMEWFIAPTKIDGTSPDPTKAPHVINNSWGCLEGCPPEPGNPLRDTLIASRAAGIVYVASAGNDGPECNTIFHPLARYPEAFSVGSTTHTTDMISSFSSRGPTALDPNNPAEPLYLKPNISAPGSTIRSAQRASDTAYANLSGTSMAGPHVAGLVALVISANPALAGNVDRIEEIIELSAAKKTTTEGCGVPADSNTAVPNNTYGWGRIDALAAVNLALADITPVPLVGIASRKTHGAEGAFNVDLPLVDPIGIECRAGQPANGNHTVVFTFANPITSVTGAAIDSGTGSVNSRAIGADPREYIVNLSGVANAQRLRLTLTGIMDSAGNSTPTLSVAIGFLLGDTTANTSVNSSDITETKALSGQTTNGSNFRSDVTVNGVLNSSDIGVVKSNSGTDLP